MVIQILLILLSTTEVLLLLENSSEFQRTTERVWQKYFFDRDNNYEDIDSNRIRNFFSI